MRTAAGTGLAGLAWLALAVMLTTSSAGARSGRPGSPEGAPAPAAAGQGESLFGPAPSYAPIELTFSGGLPRQGDFIGAQFTVDGAHITNSHPYTAYGEPKPGGDLFAVLDVTVQNPTSAKIDYGFDDEALFLRTYSGRLLPALRSPGLYDFYLLEPGSLASDQVVFGIYDVDVLEGAALLIGQPPDVPTIVALTAPPLPPDFPRVVSAAADAPVQAGPIEWSVTTGTATLDRPAGACCFKTGARANEGELFITFGVRGVVSGSKYGQATVASDALRVVVDGQRLEVPHFQGKGSVPEGTAYEMSVTLLIPDDATQLALEVGSDTDEPGSIPLVIGEPTPETGGPSELPAASSAPA